MTLPSPAPPRAASGPTADRRIRALRPPKPPVDLSVAHGWLVEDERRPGGAVERALTVFLAGAECPFTCAFCDLWRWTTDGATPPGALPRQLERVLGELARPLPARIKLYNASNFFDRRAVPAEDVPAIVGLVEPFAGVTVESHVNTIGPATFDFARGIAGRLEVAAGLETIHPEGARHLNKRLDLARFDRAAELLGAGGVDLRVFVLLGVPYVPTEASVEWAVRSAAYAAARGAAVVSIIPVRGGNGEMERLAALGHFTPPTLRQLEAALDACVEALAPTVVTADLWDAGKLAACAACGPLRVERLRAMNVSGVLQPPVSCAECAAS
ncbi:MAG: radical SAM protein [Gemmatimonadaceae bacterium]